MHSVMAPIYIYFYLDTSILVSFLVIMMRSAAEWAVSPTYSESLSLNANNTGLLKNFMYLFICVQLIIIQMFLVGLSWSQYQFSLKKICLIEYWWKILCRYFAGGVNPFFVVVVKTNIPSLTYFSDSSPIGCLLSSEQFSHQFPWQSFFP